ncbi:MAG: Flp pilus assembly complex ATPase component [Euryarchaeota archaeon]|nr:Flp pilus assembly complex ATPase component [Euryarchaeota archaeon]
MKAVVPDTSVLVDGRITELITEEEYRGCRVLVSEVVVAELEHQAQEGKESGFKGLAELKMLKEQEERGLIEMEFIGSRPRGADFRDNDHLIREEAREAGAVLVTSDRVQAEVARAMGVEVLYLGGKRAGKEPGIMDFFDEDTMSVHLKDRVPPMAKKGTPGNITLMRLSEEPMDEARIQALAGEIMEYARGDPDSFIEIEAQGATVVQMGNVRIAITRPPFSDGYEITAVRPVAEVSLQDYRLSGRLLKRLEERAEGVLVAGPPGAGKSTFAQALAEFYKEKGRIVKTMESPRDLMVSDEITQYAPLEGDMEKTADILLLVRPDYTIYDEVRKTRDFEVFADMRLAGVGMVGVTHASKAIDAVQRLIGRVELGMIPQVVDTVVYIKDGSIEKVYYLEFTVKVPLGMAEADLARPVIEVKAFETGAVEYEIYTFGEETIVMPVLPEEERRSQDEANRRLLFREMKRRAPKAYMEVEVEGSRATVWVEDGFIPKLIGRKGKSIGDMEKKLGMKIQVNPLSAKNSRGEKIRMRVLEKGRHVILQPGREYSGEEIGVYVDGAFAFSGKVSKKGEIKVTQASDVGQYLLEAVASGSEIYGVRE